MEVIVGDFGLPENLQIISSESSRSILITYKRHKFCGTSTDFVSYIEFLLWGSCFYL